MTTPLASCPLLHPGYTPCDLQSAYQLPASSTGAGTGQTVAVVDAYDAPTAEADLNVYRSTYGLSPCTTANGCFKKVNQNGVQGSYPSVDTSWAQEISLDLDMVSAGCPNCHILLVEAANANVVNLGVAEETAAALGAQVISNSYGVSESAFGSAPDSSHYNHPGHAIVVSSGDTGYGTQFPASSPYVTAVGGTTLTKTNSVWSESVWAGASSGCSQYFAKPSWQTDSGCTKRTVADVAAVGDPNTGVAVYDSTPDTSGHVGWLEFGGTSVAAPVIAAVYAVAGNGSSVNYGSYPYAHVSGLYDVTTGTNGVCTPPYLCTGGTGYDGPTGLGTPRGTAAF